MKKLSSIFIAASMIAFSVSAQNGTTTTTHKTQTVSTQQNPDPSTHTTVTHKKHVVVHSTKPVKSTKTVKHTTSTTTQTQ